MTGMSWRGKSYLVETFETAEAASNQNFRILLDFSLGRRDDRTTMTALGIDSEEDLFLLMVQARMGTALLAEYEDVIRMRLLRRSSDQESNH